jgi:hypothetical protein
MVLAIHPVKLEFNLEKINLTEQLKLLNSIAKNTASVYVIFQAQKRTRLKCNNITMNYNLLQLNYSVIFNSFTPLVKCYNLNIFYNVYERRVQHVAGVANGFHLIYTSGQKMA